MWKGTPFHALGEEECAPNGPHGAAIDGNEMGQPGCPRFKGRRVDWKSGQSGSRFSRERPWDEAGQARPKALKHPRILLLT